MLCAAPGETVASGALFRSWVEERASVYGRAQQDVLRPQKRLPRRERPAHNPTTDTSRLDYFDAEADARRSSLAGGAMGLSARFPKPLVKARRGLVYEIDGPRTAVAKRRPPAYARFSKAPDRAAPRKPGPGPGTYAVEDAWAAKEDCGIVRRTAIFSSTVSKSPFAAKGGRRNFALTADVLAAPAPYDVPAPRPSHLVSAPFKSTSHRFSADAAYLLQYGSTQFTTANQLAAKHAAQLDAIEGRPIPSKVVQKAMGAPLLPSQAPGLRRSSVPSRRPSFHFVCRAGLREKRGLPPAGRRTPPVQSPVDDELPSPFHGLARPAFDSALEAGTAPPDVAVPSGRAALGGVSRGISLRIELINL
ncbi:hypothetical protein M885DRAFT_509382 [Pelagophyceae sp. CCMP2097]|nr:hypothetical protein M885DRAFT_509382 [Pelagophyceae sp. CCMP2097]